MPCTFELVWQLMMHRPGDDDGDLSERDGFFKHGDTKITRWDQTQPLLSQHPVLRCSGEQTRAVGRSERTLLLAPITGMHKLSAAFSSLIKSTV